MEKGDLFATGSGELTPAHSAGGEAPAARRGLPHHLEAERSVLGAILVRNEALDEVREVGLQSRDFYLENNRVIYEACESLYDRRQPVDLVTLSGLLRDRGHLDRVGGTAALTQVFEDGFTVRSAVHYARFVKDKAVLRRMIHACQKLIQEATGGVEDTEEFLDHAETEVFNVANTATQSSFASMDQILLSNVKRIEELNLSKLDVTGLETGFTGFDNLTAGLQPGQIVVVAARPGMGKTSWLISMIQHAAIVNQAVVAFFSLEMSKEELGFKFLSGLSRIDSKSMKTGKLSDGDWRRLLDASDRLSKAKIFIDDSGALSGMDVRARCRRLKATQKKLDLIVVDYLQLMKGSRASRSGDGSREREIAEISRSMKELAKELGVPIILLSQLNRGVESRQDKRPMLADLRESGAIEQDADIVCFIHREDYYNKETEDKGIAELIVAKNRAGEQGTVRLAWIGQYTLFANLNDDEPGTPVGAPRTDKGDLFL